MNAYFSGSTDFDPTKYPDLTYAEAQATGTTTTSSSTYSLLNSMTITPVAGTYVAVFSTTVDAAVLLGSPRVYCQIYVGGVAVSHSERRTQSVTKQKDVLATNCLVTVNGSQAVEVRWRTTAGTANCYSRTLTLFKVAEV